VRFSCNGLFLPLGGKRAVFYIVRTPLLREQKMRKALVVLSLSSLAALLPAFAGAQSTDAGTGGNKEKMRERFEERFSKADANGDGKLSKSEAAAMPRVAKNFDAIDANHDGFVTKAEITQAMMAQRGAAKGGSQ
jgi:hypothetical protein